VEHSDVLAASFEAGLLRDDGFAEVQVDKAGGGERGGVVWVDGGELALVVVIAVYGGVVDAADVDDGVAGGEDGGVAGADEGGGGVGREKAEEVDGEGFVGVEVAAGRGVSRGFDIEELAGYSESFS
jgi:hypothetical protein